VDGSERESAPSDKFDLPGIVALVDETLATAGESLEVGDRIIAGSLTTPVDVQPGQSVALDLGPLGFVEIDFTD
jgi:2-keto-4-pentenoate hydratase